jgi:uncharacterized protein
MKHTISFKAKGHKNIRSKHKTTLMITMDQELSTRGDCIISVGAEIGLSQLPHEIKNMAQDSDTKITFVLETNNHRFIAVGRGHPDLTYEDSIDMVARKSTYICGRTLMINSDEAAIDLPKDLVDELRDPEIEVSIKIIYEKG